MLEAYKDPKLIEYLQDHGITLERGCTTNLLRLIDANGNYVIASGG